MFSILVVDDDRDFAEGFSEILESHGYSTVVAHSVPEAQQLLSEQMTHVALLDIRMGQQNGLNLLHFIRQNYPDIICIMMTAYSGEDQAIRALKDGAYDYLRKPINPRELLNTLTRAFEKISLMNEKRQTENALRESEARIQAVLKALPGIALLMDEDGIYESVWTANPELLFETSQSIIGKHVEDIFPTKEARMFNNFLHKTIETGKPQILEYYLPINKRDCWFEARSSLLTGPDGRRKIFTIIFDITEKKQFEAEALRNSQLAALGELASGVAHEINNPITGIINYAQIIYDQTPTGSDENGIASRIINEGERIADIVNKLLAYGREYNREYQLCEIPTLLNNCLQLAKQQLRQDGIEVTLDIPENLPRVLAVPNEIQQVFINILNNTRYALNKKFPDHHPDKRIEFTAQTFRAEGRLLVRLICLDNGIGIPADIIDKIFQPFFTTKSPGEGTGLGLNISYKIIKEHGGVLKFESVENQFTKAIIELPAMQESE